MNAFDGSNPNENNPNPSKSNDHRKGKKKIENVANLHSTFSKRRDSLFKKASELNTLCGVESAVVVFSPGERAHAYGHPNVETITNRFLNANVGPTPVLANPLLVAHQEASNLQVNHELVRMEGLLEHKRQRNRELNHMLQPRINELNYEQLNRLQESVLGFKSIFESRLKDATSSMGATNVHGPNPKQGGPGPSVGYTNPSGFDMMSYPNVGYGAGDSNVLIPYNFSNPGGRVSFGNMATTTLDTEAKDETQDDVSNRSQGQGSRRTKGRRGRS